MTLVASMMRMNAETVGDTGADTGRCDAACRVVGFVDAAGNRLDARCFG
ncbi:MAG: hypothetical protein OXE94_08985 [Aestuariivita sp.]|nr:hypothetical protein [Aestuariivita sp.]MCY4201137.1 hypothetical protein [Aestuariivita sp.]MCY4287802.1 hypothetical protein [Aestuariivita sp.]MCY4345968.1 hypothetical protein [Aestuariivita sp.]